MAFQKEFAKVIAKAWSDPRFKEQLLKNPEKVLNEQGISIPSGKQVKICENTESTFHLVIPEKPKEVLSEQELEAIAAGKNYNPTCWGGIS